VNSALETIDNPLTGEKVTFIETAESTGGARSVFEILLAPRGKGPPLHSHTVFTEVFEVLEGELMLQLGKNTTRLKQGQRAVMHPHQPHTFWSESDQPIRFRGTIEPGNRDTEDCFRIAFGLARDGLVRPSGIPRRLSHLVILASMSQSRISGVGAFITPILNILARTSKVIRTQRELIQRYC
jgi:quercetin dioxygenase-like cupin family protein